MNGIRITLITAFAGFLFAGCSNPSGGDSAPTEVGRTVTSVVLNTVDGDGYGLGDSVSVSAVVSYQVEWSDGSTTVETDSNVGWTGGNGDGSIDFTSFGAVTLTAASVLDADVSASVTLTANDLNGTVWKYSSITYTFGPSQVTYTSTTTTQTFGYTVSGTTVSWDYWVNPAANATNEDFSDEVISTDHDYILQ